MQKGFIFGQPTIKNPILELFFTTIELGKHFFKADWAQSLTIFVTILVKLLFKSKDSSTTFFYQIYYFQIKHRHLSKVVFGYLKIESALRGNLKNDLNRHPNVKSNLFTKCSQRRPHFLRIVLMKAFQI